MILRPAASPAEATPPDSLTAQVRTLLASPRSALLPADVRQVILNLAVTVDAHGARLRALEKVNP